MDAGRLLTGARGSRSPMNRRSGMTLIETLVAVVILATALIGMAHFMASFSHVTKTSALRARALDLAADRIDSVEHSPDYSAIDTTATIESITADSATYERQTMVQHIGGGPADTLDYRIVTVAVTIPNAPQPVRKTVAIAAF
jgi:prepilin-type N-terminal cleavage/methylation domain-containing protein